MPSRKTKGRCNILLIQPPRPGRVDRAYFATQIPINLAYIAASLEEEGANVRIADFCVEELRRDGFLKLLREFRPEIVAFTSMTSSICSVKELAKIAKEYKRDLLTILGGIHISALPRKTLEEIPHIDLGVVGEGEETIKEIYHLKLSDKPIRNVRGTVCRTGGRIRLNPGRALIKDLDSIPFPARHLLEIKNYNKAHVTRGFSRKHLKIMEILTTRGCPQQCIFCAGHINYGYCTRFRSYENIVSEIDHLIRTYGIDHISIEDDTFTMNRQLVKRICGYFRRRGIKWLCNARVDTVDFELLKLMKRSGCERISFGVESGSPRILRLIKKNITLEQVRNAFKWARKAGIKYVEGSFMLGSHPDEKMEDIRATEKLIFELMPDFIVLAVICPFPGTELYEIMEKGGLLERNPDWSRFTIVTNKLPFKRLNHLTASQLLKMQKEILRKYYASPRYVFHQVRKIRSIREMSYFLNIGLCFAWDFILFRNRGNYETMNE